MLLAVDPGKDLGWALWNSNGLSRVGLGYPLPVLSFDDGIIAERPEIHKASPARPDDILTLAIRLGMTLSTASRTGARVHLVSPHSWKGNVKKPIHGARILAALTPEEQKILFSLDVPEGKRHNVLDAIGIGKWFLANRVMWRQLRWQG